MEIRIQRSISVMPKWVREFIRIALETDEHAKRVMGVESDIFYDPHRASGNAEFRIFTDFDSLAQYEEVFLGKLLHDSKYLELSEKAVDMIVDEPLDELFVRLKPDDYFMHRGKTEKRQTHTFETARPARKKLRYRREREYCASKGRLREVMQMNFGFMEDFFRATGSPPDYFCTRFSVERIGCSKIFWDYDECPMCDPAFIEQDSVINTKSPGLLLRTPTDRLYVRVTPEQQNFNLRALQH